MAFSIEARVPFVDYRVVECALNIPATYKIPQRMVEISAPARGRGDPSEGNPMAERQDGIRYSAE